MYVDTVLLNIYFLHLQVPPLAAHYCCTFTRRILYVLPLQLPLPLPQVPVRIFNLLPPEIPVGMFS